MKKVLIVGLGLMGGSIAKALPAEKYTVFGADTSIAVCERAVKDGVVSDIWDMKSEICVDVVLLCTSPKTTESFLKERLTFVSSGAVVSDICGIKREIVSLGESECAKRGLHFVGGHPMAGRERNGYENSTPALFKNRSYILTKTDNTNSEAFEAMSRLALDIGCSDVTLTSPEEHDRMIAFTSQVPHVLAGAYMKSPSSDRHQGFSAGSYHDVSRVASVDENLWTELFISNSDNLINELSILINNLNEYQKALENADSVAVKEAIRQGRVLKERDITVNGTEKPHKFG